MLVLCAATASTSGFRRFLETARRQGATPTVLGWRQPWRGWGERLQWVARALAEVDSAELVLLTDAYDVLWVRPPAEVLAAYRTLGEPPLLLSAEVNCWPRAEWSERFPATGTPYRYPNGGGWLGRVGHVHALFQRYRLDELAADGNDQEWWQHVFLAEPDAAQLDSEARIFQCVQQAEGHLVYQPGEIRNQVTGTLPVLLHGNGRADLLPGWQALTSRSR